MSQARIRPDRILALATAVAALLANPSESAGAASPTRTGPGEREARAAICTTAGPYAAGPFTARPYATGPYAADPYTAAVRTRTPHRVELKPTANALGASAFMELTFAASPFGVTVDRDGRYVYDVRITVEALRRREDAVYVVWAATPNLDQVVRLGVLGDEMRVSGRVDWNKFLVFVTEERSLTDEARWQGPILLTGMSPSGLMHTMRGHGIFENDPC